ncbi:hypothetical protein F504_4806 (plasmid) [Ralstonia pseudosolanacearum FQY_4]|nr:hypothetical protein F504_4806 [Ralstonia pseudosolanacearum FQY_4]
MIGTGLSGTENNFGVTFDGPDVPAYKRNCFGIQSFCRLKF